MNRYKGIIRPSSENSKSYVLQIVLVQPEGELNIRKFEFFDWHMKPVENCEKYFVAMFSESYVIIDSCIVDSLEVFHSGRQDDERTHSPNELFDRMYSYCKNSLDTTQNAIKLQKPKVEDRVRYALARQKKNERIPGNPGISYYWQFYQPISRNWSLNCLGLSVRRCTSEREFIDFLDTIPSEVMSENELYVSKIINSGNGLKTEHVKIKDFLAENFS